MLSRIISWIAQEVIVKTLVNSKTFQRIALKIDSKLKINHKFITEKVDSVTKDSKPIVEPVLLKAKEYQTKTNSFITTFRKIFNEEMQKNQSQNTKTN